MKNIDKQKLNETIDKLSSIANSGSSKVTSHDRFVLGCLMELALILDTDPAPENVDVVTAAAVVKTDPADGAADLNDTEL